MNEPKTTIIVEGIEHEGTFLELLEIARPLEYEQRRDACTRLLIWLCDLVEAKMPINWKKRNAMVMEVLGVSPEEVERRAQNPTPRVRELVDEVVGRFIHGGNFS